MIETELKSFCRISRLVAVAPVLMVFAVTDVSGATKVGTTAAVNTAAFGAAPGSVRKAKLLGDNVFYNERIETSQTGLVQVLLNDGSTFTVGANSDLIIDEFVYDPDSGTGKIVATLSKGVARFVGGKLSKKRGGVTVKTPVGTIGIRGGIANLDVTGADPVFSLIFGDELTFNGAGGGKRRLYQPGYSLQVGDVGNRVRRTTQSDLNSIQAGLSSVAGQRGGVSKSPTNEQIDGSGIAQVNSGLGDVETAPKPKPQSIQSTGLREAEGTLVDIQTATSQGTLDQIKSETPDIPVKPEIPVDPIDPEIPVETVDVRILSAGTHFAPVWDSSNTTSKPGEQGLIGGSFGLNENVSFSFGEVTSGNATELVKGTVEGTKIYQFAFEGSGGYLYSQTYNDQGRVAQNGDLNLVPAQPDIDGTVTSYAWGAQYYNENFASFAHIPNVTPGADPAFDINNLVIGIWGVGTDFDNFGDASGASNVRKYTLAPDPTTMFALGSSASDGTFRPLLSQALFVNPLVAAELGVDFMKRVGSSDLLLIEDTPNTLDGGRFLASSFHLDGVGALQKSLISLAVGNVTLPEENQNGVMRAERRGGHRLDGDQSAALYSGALGTVGGPDGSEFFGSNAQSFVIGSDLSAGALDNPFNDTYAVRPGVFEQADTLSASLHVGQLVEGGEKAVAALFRTDRTISGYAAGSLESTVNINDYKIGAVGFASKAPSDFSMSFDGSKHTLGGTLTVRDALNKDPEVDSYTIRFGFNGDKSEAHRATFIDNDTYAARDAKNHSETFLTTDSAQTADDGSADGDTNPAVITGGGFVDDGGSTVPGAGNRSAALPRADSSQVLEQNPGNNPDTYVVPSTLVSTADDAIMNSVTECTCAFLEWGYWGTKLNYDNADGVLTSSENREDSFHLGTWVAGDVTNSVDLPTSGTASYVGHAVGNVINNNAQYLAAGNFNMSVDFASRTGSASISDFDGRVFGADLTEKAIASGNHFSGVLAGGTMTGGINASVVGGPANKYQGAIGNFNAVDGTWSATGIVAGEMK